MPVLGQTPTEGHFNATTPIAPAGAVNVAFQASAAYPDPNNPILQVRDITANIAKFGGDSGSGGTIGAVPAPAAGDAAAGKFLKADGSWQIPAGGGSGTVTHSESLTDGEGNFIFAGGDIVTVVGVPN